MVIAVTLADEDQRRRALTDFEAIFLVEAAAGTGKTSLMACRVAMILVTGIPPAQIAAITFTDAAASELARRIHWVVTELLEGRVPIELRIAVDRDLSALQRDQLAKAAESLDELTCSTIHGFCQAIIAGHAVDVGLDPGARIADEYASEAMFDEAFADWLVEALSSGLQTDEGVVVLAEDEPLELERRLRDLAGLRNRYRRARPPLIDSSLRPDVVLTEAIDEFDRWLARFPQDRYTADVAQEFQRLRTHFDGAFSNRPGFKDLWRLARPPQLNLMKRRSHAFRAYQRLGAWKKALGEQGEQANEEATRHYGRVEAGLASCLGHVAGMMVEQLSESLQKALDGYTELKRRAAVLDFDDLLEQARNLLASSDRATATVAERFRYILVDECQDTDPVQAEILFTIASEERTEDWRTARLRPGSLFLVGDPKQSIYRFRGADTAIYTAARDTVLAQPGGALIEITANFRSSQPITDYTNSRFAHVFGTPDQPRYVPLSATIAPPHGSKIPVVAKLTIDEGDDSPGTLRQAEAQAVARLCEDLVGRYPVRRRDGTVTPARAGDIALLAPSYTDLWRYEGELESRHFGVASQAGKALMRRQETQDVLALIRTLADPRDRLAFGALLRGPLVALTDQEIADITFALPEGNPYLGLRTPLEAIGNDYARKAVSDLQKLYWRSRSVPPSQLLSEAVEALGARLILSARHGNRNARALANLDALIDRGRRYSVAGLRSFARDLQRQWDDSEPVQEGRSDVVEDAIQIVTMHACKGLEWPIVIPVGTATRLRSAPQFVHRQVDSTLHWVLGGLAPPELEETRLQEERLQARERERMWYVVCTRARDLLVLPKMTGANANSWSRVIDLGYDALEEIDVSGLPQATTPTTVAFENDQTSERFREEQLRVTASAPSITWLRPSLHEDDKLAPSVELAESSDLVFAAATLKGAGAARGTLLHKLMEEVLNGEVAVTKVGLAVRAAELSDQLFALDLSVIVDRPEPEEMANTVLSTLGLADVSRLMPHLNAELAVWHQNATEYLAGRADALAHVDGRVVGVIDWKSDVSPTPGAKLKYVDQVDSYRFATGAVAGAVIFMTTGEIVWSGDRAGLFNALGLEA